jgi:drug/metabolite transporter (DMT)-like permease
VVASAICWTLAVVCGLLAGAVFASGSVLCQSDRPEACTPQTGTLVVGVILALGFGAAGAALHKPRQKPRSRFPWEYPR